MPATTPAIFVAGPTVVKVTIGESESILGYSDNDNLPSISFTDHQHEIKTVLSGAVAEEIVLQGTSARIALALVKWDQTVFQSLLANQRGAQTVTTVGRRIIGATAYCGLKIISAATGATMSYSFTRAYLSTDSFTDSQWGNRERVLTLNFSAIPQSDGVLYTYTP